jgi:lipopolysaccharide/colanic/teichoic acid biosynthesis glycosyltransferase
MSVAAPSAGSRTASYTSRVGTSGQFRTGTAPTYPEVQTTIVPTQGADLSLVVTSPDDVFPADRSEFLARAVNVSVAAVALVVLSPVIALTALAVRLTSKGPIFYSQVRVGVDRRFRQKRTDCRRVQDFGGKPFKKWKFRTMVVDAEKDGKAVWAQKSDPRVTSIGKILRRTRLDELPQLYNVLRGEMNIVSPRPERPTIFAELRQTIPQYHMRQRVKPGITGWAQINQAYDSCLDDVRSKVDLDLEYMRRQSLTMDLRIMATTVPVMVFRRGGW